MTAQPAAYADTRSLDEISAAIEAIAAGEPVVVIGQSAAARAVLTIAAADATAGDVTRMAAEARGVVCAAATTERLDELEIPPLTGRSGLARHAETRVGVDHRECLHDAMSAAARAQTARALADPSLRASDFSVPGRLFPLAARSGGVLRRADPVEAAVDLARLAGVTPVALLCEIVGDDGAPASIPAAMRLARRTGAPVVSVDALVRFRLDRDLLVRRVVETALPLPAGPFRAIGYESAAGAADHVALALGDPAAPGAPRFVHLRCGGEALGLCGCRARLDSALAEIAAAGDGVLAVLAGEDRPSITTQPRCATSASPQELPRLLAGIARSIFGDLGIRDLGIR
ncbi:3,4-dihydroxy-2-butanone-4-phosphate synthase [Conexibacter woesei]|uniref:3,4-dihydroxy-2-butanone-4-phosphate synthase n=1 Tax=Conexibacter woesei (strain DSM 14684 / CCUG 47730 / CIP 108061 / JCM 11494 / NBRC 100937 / ID131577) TaxID=469383 RepID=D3F5A1_CONWI|nr:3,4-dihydroxy-2-butanone-4-phosphate synthase [Conexibacter woesei]ADB50568.1 34-dihydroxy-2-butanone 4-phosphate synthase [Conexibacter woesei DSM 14684]